MKKKTEQISLCFVYFYAKGIYKINCAMKYFEKARFEVADEIGIYDYIKPDEGERVTFPVIRVRSKYLNPIQFENRNVLTETSLDIPDGGILCFHHRMIQNGEVMIETVVETVIVSDRHGVLFKIGDELTKKIREYIDE